MEQKDIDILYQANVVLDDYLLNRQTPSLDKIEVLFDAANKMKKEHLANEERISNEKKKEKIIENILGMNCEQTNELMWGLGFWEEGVQKVDYFGKESIGNLIVEMNGYGYRVEITIEPLHDEYVYSCRSKTDNGCILIYGLGDNSDEWESWFDFNIVAKKIMTDEYAASIYHDVMKKYK